MKDSPESVEPVLFEFIEQFCVDTMDGAPPPLSHYLARFPKVELEVATEYLRLVRDGAAPNDSPSAIARLESGELWRRMEMRRADAARYRIASEIAHGGMGTIHLARDVELERDVAIKRTRRESTRALEKLLGEARVTGRLDHPGVVPVHDLGLDDEGRLFFSMRLVQGRDFAQVIEALHARDPEWTLSRVLEVLVKVCDTMAYAHSRGILHRDLKPSNVRVGEFGEVYVLDWGLARDTERALDRLDDRIRVARAGATLDVRTASEPSPLCTVEGDVLGTPYYMPPEQARGELASIDARSDVWAAGAMLYHLIAGRPPYASPTGKDVPREVLERVCDGAPRSLESVAPDAPRELVSICSKAMQRDPAARYADMREFGRDLRAFLDRRVVAAHESGPIAELRAWSRRNRGLSASVAALFLLGLWGAWMLRRSDVQEREHLRERLSLQEREQADLELFADVHDAIGLRERYDELWPASAAKRTELADWLRRADALVAKSPARRTELASLRERADPPDPNSRAESIARAEYARHLQVLRDHRDYYEREFDRIAVEGGTTIEHEGLDVVADRFEKFSLREANDESTPPARKHWSFASSRDQTRHDLCAQFEVELATLESSANGPSRIEAVRAALADPIRPPADSRALANWSDVARDLGDSRSRLIYGEISLAPQNRLVPLGRDAQSGLFEFACEGTGAIPGRDVGGALALDADSALVLVLIPGGMFTRGAQSASPLEPNYDPAASSDEHPLKTFPIEPFFLSKFELTRAQWQRLSGRAPWSTVFEGPLENPSDSLAAAGNFSWNDARLALSQVGLEMPTEAQWEWAARAGATTPWSSGSDPLALVAAANVYDLAAERAHDAIWLVDDARLPVDDGAALVARIGSYCPNAFGLFDMHGNVGEFCRDVGALAYLEETALGTLERSIHAQGVVVWRGGCFAAGADAARSTARHYCGPDWTQGAVGVRPARTIER